MPRVSVLLTCYNHREYIEEAVSGVVNQTFSDWELIAIDDGSTDGTREWLTSAPGVNKVIINETNLGTYGTLNKALHASSGDLVAVLNDDDVWLPRKLEAQVAAMDTNLRVGLSHTAGCFIDGRSQVMSDPEPLGFPFPRTGNGDQLAPLIERNRIINSATLVRRECFEELGDWDAAFYGCGDWHMWLRIARKYEIAFIDERLTDYRVHATNASRNDQKMIDDSRRIREWIATWDPSEFVGRGGVWEALALNYAALGTERMWNGDARGAREACLRSIRMRPWRWQTYARLAATLLPRRQFRALH